VHNGRHRSGFVFLDDLDSRGKFILLGTKKGFRFSGLMVRRGHRARGEGKLHAASWRSKEQRNGK
jgi:hypothetical protein